MKIFGYKKVRNYIIDFEWRQIKLAAVTSIQINVQFENQMTGFRTIDLHLQMSVGPLKVIDGIHRRMFSDSPGVFPGEHWTMYPANDIDTSRSRKVGFLFNMCALEYYNSKFVNLLDYCTHWGMQFRKNY